MTEDGKKFTITEVMIIIIVVLVLAVIVWLIWRRCNKNVEKKIRREISRSLELLAIGIQNTKC